MELTTDSNDSYYGIWSYTFRTFEWHAGVCACGPFGRTSKYWLWMGIYPFAIVYSACGSYLCTALGAQRRW